jgi:ribosomal protein L32
MNDSVYIYDGKNFQELGEIEPQEQYKYEYEEVEILNKCVNCGAPTEKDGHCPYCGTYNRKVVRKNYA